LKAASRALGAVTHGLGVVAFLYPFFLPGPASAEGSAHASEAPYLFSIFAVLLIAIAIAELRAGEIDAKEIALLGVLAGLNAVLRLPGSFGGASLMFVLPILCGAVYGARFGFLLGATSMAASALITGGVGPWLPFQMWALGWVGAGAAIVRARGDGWRTIAGLAVYGWIAGMLFGAIVNLWFWPYQQGAGALAWQPGLGVAEGLRHYWRFYTVTSLAWDSGRALGNVVIVVLLGRPLLRLFEKFRARLRAAWTPEPRATMEAA
jgi:energy-coupling factor transport system substrate-specific component